MPSAVAAPVSVVRDARLARLGDERLAARVQTGDERAFAVIYDRHGQALYRYCRSILRDEGDAQDALQSTFERAFSALLRRQRNAPLRPWLYRIAHNEAISVIRRRRVGELPEPDGALFAPSAEQQVADRARLATLVEDLADLPERARNALVMRELADLSHEEIAIALSVSTAVAKQSIFEARRALQDAAEGRAMSCEAIRRQISDGDRRVLRGRRIRSHLRDCAGCAAFAGAIPARRADLRALAPVMPPAAALLVFHRALETLSGHAGASGAGGGSAAGAAGAAGGSGGGTGVAVGAAGKTVATAALGSKVAAVGAVALVTAAVGVGGVVTFTHGATHVRPADARTKSGALSRRARHSASARASSARKHGKAGHGRAAVASGSAAGARAIHRGAGASALHHARHMSKPVAPPIPSRSATRGAPRSGNHAAVGTTHGSAPQGYRTSPGQSGPTPGNSGSSQGAGRGAHGHPRHGPPPWANGVARGNPHTGSSVTTAPPAPPKHGHHGHKHAVDIIGPPAQ